MKRSAFLAVACAGCVSYVSMDESTGKVDVTRERARAIPWSANGRVGMCVAGLFLSRDKDRDFYGDGFYIDLRYRYELGRHLGVEASAGYFHADSKPIKDPLTGLEFKILDDVDCLPLRVSFTFGGESRNHLVRWFAGGGGGYLFYGSEHSTIERPVDNEWASHVIAGVELKPSTHLEFPICSRIDVGYICPGESEKDMWMVGLTLYFGF